MLTASFEKRKEERPSVGTLLLDFAAWYQPLVWKPQLNQSRDPSGLICGRVAAVGRRAARSTTRSN